MSDLPPTYQLEPAATPDEEPSYRQFNDLDMLQFEQQVKEDQANLLPLVSLSEPLENLIPEYIQGSQIYVKKIEDLSKSYSKLRRCRGDGNCFYRALSFSLFEKLMLGTTESFNSFYQLIHDSPTLLKKAGFESIVIEDFYDTVIAHLKQYSPDSQEETSFRQELLVSMFQTDETSNAIVVYLRFLTSAYLKLNADDYLPFILDDPSIISAQARGNDVTPIQMMETFCNLNVEAMGKESDEIHITALSLLLSIPIKVAYLDGHSSNPTSPHANFLEYSTQEANAKKFIDSPITLLYRPGHYDILYLK